MNVGTLLFLLAGGAVTACFALIAIRTHGSWKTRSSQVSRDAGVNAFRVFVRSRQQFVPGILNQWAIWNDRLGGGPTLVVRGDCFEVAAPQGMMLESRDLVMSSVTAEMWPDKVGLGWGRFAIFAKEGIHVAARDQAGRRVELALTPKDSSIKDLWEALRTSGVSPRVGVEAPSN